jgi:hypothetical protein
MRTIPQTRYPRAKVLRNGDRYDVYQTAVPHSIRIGTFQSPREAVEFVQGRDWVLLPTYQVKQGFWMNDMQTEEEAREADCEWMLIVHPDGNVEEEELI